jgi:hypothetical protein
MLLRLIVLLGFLVPAPPAAGQAQGPTFDIVVAKGRVMDPESGLDAVPMDRDQ